MDDDHICEKEVCSWWKSSVFVILLLFCFIFLGIFFSGYSVFGHEGYSPIRIAMNAWPGYSHHTFLALENGFFEEEGVDVEINMFNEYMDSLNAFRDGKVDGFFGVYSDAISLAAEGYPVSVVYVSDFSNGGDVIMASPNVRNVSNLKGRTVSVAELNSFSHLFVLDLLEKNGLNENDVNIVVVPEPEVLKMLELGYIDAGHTFEPFQSEAIAKGYNLIASSADVPGSIVDVLVVRKDVAQNHPEKVKGVIEGLFLAERFLVENPEQSRSYISERTGVTSYDLNEELKGIKILNREENKDIFNETKAFSLYARGEFIVDFFMKKGVISEPVDLDELIDSRFVLD
ncbi:ABC transporter substrate-binding protein [Candidatus Pacearchaeota archaeon]|nr:ABC transporter substrate-binding protein [Candidatus Pacearchaeota archaeon]